MKFNQKDYSDEKWNRDRKLFIESFPGEKTFVTLNDNKNIIPKINLIRSVSVKENQYPIDGDIDFREKIIPVNIIMGLETLNDNGAGIFMVINECDGLGRKQENIIRIRAIVADFDDPNKELPEFTLEPSIIVETSKNRYHVAWLSDNIPIEGFRQLQEGLIYKYNSDHAFKSTSQAVRVPGFYHNKGKRFMSNIVHYTGKKYDFGLLTESFPPKPVKQWSAPQFKKDLYSNQKEFTGKRGVSTPGRNAHVIKCIGGMIARGLSYAEIEAEVYLEAESCSPPLDAFDIKNLLKSARGYV